MILTDKQWEKLESLLLGTGEGRGMRKQDNRLFLEAVLWCASARRWRSLPPEFGKWNTVYMRFRRWNMGGIWHRLKEDVKDDPELLAQLEKIVARADHSRPREAQTVNVKNVRRAYSLPMWKGGGEGQPHASQIEAGPDWLRLAMGAMRQRINNK